MSNFTPKDLKVSLRGGSKMKAGFHENVKFTGASVNEDGSYDLHFENQSGEVQHKRVWAYDPEQVRVRDGESLVNAQIRDSKERVEPITDLIEILAPEVYNSESFPSEFPREYKAYLAKAVDIINKHKDTATVNIKLIPDKTLQYSEFPNFGTWVTKYEEGKPHNLSYSKWELENRVDNPTKNVDTPILNGDAAPDFDLFS